MYRLKREDYTQPEYVSLWALLGFQAGFINTFGFLACGRYVSHVTGFGTQIGIALAEAQIAFAIELLGFPVAFITGSFMSALITSARIERQKKPRFDIVTFALPISILCLLILGARGIFGPFGEQLIQTRDFILLFLLSFVCGIQNGCFATMTKGQIRTTHLTGISTDIGTDLARIWFGQLNPTEQELTTRINFCRVATFCAFAGGSIASVFSSQRWTYGALSVPLLTSLAVCYFVRKIGRKLDKEFLQEQRRMAVSEARAR